MPILLHRLVYVEANTRTDLLIGQPWILRPKPRDLFVQPLNRHEVGVLLKRPKHKGNPFR